MKTIIIFLIIFILFSCKSDKKGFYKSNSINKKIDVEVIKNYHPKIDSSVKQFVHDKFGDNVNYKKMVYFPQMIIDKKIIETDTSIYNVNLSVYLEGEIMKFTLFYTNYGNDVHFGGYEERQE